MNFLYNILISIAYFFLKIVALFNPKMKLFVNGRKASFQKLAAIKKEDKVIWFHAASLGEFEQGRPIIEQFKTQYPKHKIIVTFFSPSGYEIRKDYELADVVCYLPFDTASNMKKFVAQVHPEIAVIIKYEFWFNLLSELQKQQIPTILVSGVFRGNQAFFKFYGSWIRKKLNAFDHFFVQNETSKKLLNQINFNNVTVSGDTRFDRVYEILQQDNSLDFIENFKDGKYTVVAGSTWKEDEDLLVNYINNSASDDEKFIIAPHNINQKSIENLRKAILKKTILYSEKDNVNLAEYQVFIADTIGILTKIYSYANAAYVGGGLTSNGVHNVLEPAVFGVPIVIGNHYQKYNEVVDLVAKKGSLVITNQEDFSTIFTKLKNDFSFRVETGNINKKYIEDNVGASQQILNYINKQLNT